MKNKLLFASVALSALAVAAVVVAQTSAFVRSIPVRLQQNTTVSGEPQFRFEGMGTQSAGVGITNNGVIITRGATPITSSSITVSQTLTLDREVIPVRNAAAAPLTLSVPAGVEEQRLTIAAVGFASTTTPLTISPSSAYGGAGTATLAVSGSSVTMRFVEGRWLYTGCVSCTYQ
ncbi:hypothetical protein EBZ39_06020 [bacterium]|nr:hypothetical protein [bacterium]